MSSSISAIPASAFGPAIDRLGDAGLLQEAPGVFRRVVIEKPFGEDLASACALNRRILAVAPERQFFRIDHFLGKESVQAIMALRFANVMFEAALHRDYVDHVEITAAETIGVEQRGSFYEPTGALRDMVPNHLFQLLCMVAMEPPGSAAAEAARDERMRLLRSIRPVTPQNAARGQYAAGAVAGLPVPGYRQEVEVAPDSRTETYAALVLDIDNRRWAGVPFFLRTGKRLGARRTEIAVHFRRPPADPLLLARLRRRGPEYSSLPDRSRASPGARLQRQGARRGDAAAGEPRRPIRAPDAEAEDPMLVTRRCSMAACAAMRRCSSVATSSRRAGRWSTRCCVPGRRVRLSAMRQAATSRPRPMRCSRAADEAGAQSARHDRGGGSSRGPLPIEITG